LKCEFSVLEYNSLYSNKYNLK